METALTSRPARCVHADRQAIAAADCRWPTGTIVSWYLNPSSRYGSLTFAQAEQAIVAGIEAWAKVCGVKLLRVTAYNQARVLVSSTPIDHLNGILGLTELPCDGRADVQHTMYFDVAEAWDPIFLEQVAMHEFGHAIGIGHAPKGVFSVMGEFYDRSLRALQPWEIGQAVSRYGPPPKAAPTSVSQSFDAESFTIKLEVDEPGEYFVEVKPSYHVTLSRAKAP